MNRILVVAFLAVAVLLPGRAVLCEELTGGVEFSFDSDDADQYGLYAGYRRTFEPSGNRLGFRAGVLNLTDPAGSERFRVLEISHRSRPLEEMRLDLEGKWLGGDGWSPLLYSLTAFSDLNDRWNLEIFGERGIVDSVSSVGLEYLIDTWGFSVDYAMTGEFTLVGALFTQDISDGNDRFGRVGRLVYTPASADWLNLQVKARILDSDFDGIGYFSPEVLSEYLFLVGAAHPFADDNWVVRGLAGPGIQEVRDHGGGTERKAASLVEVRLKGWFTRDFGLDGRFGCTTAQQTGSGTTYCYGHLNLTRVL